MYDLVLKSITTLWVLSMAFGLCTFYMPWAWNRKNYIAIIYGPFAVMTVIFGLFVALSSIWQS